VAVGKIDGVRDVKVSLNEGRATIQFAAANRVSIEQVRKAIRANGFAPGLTPG
jgi:copper chaperone CopZ